MQFINIVVHSVEDMNFRVHLQYEFTKLGLDDFLEVLSQSSLNKRLKRFIVMFYKEVKQLASILYYKTT